MTLLLEDWGYLPEIGIALAVSLVVLSILTIKDTPLPGPTEYPIVSNAFQVHQWLPNLLNALMILQEEYEWKTWTFKVPLMPRLVIITDPRCVFHVLGLGKYPGSSKEGASKPTDSSGEIVTGSFHNYPKGPLFRGVLHDLLGSGIFNSDGKRWHVQRKTASHMFSTRIMRELMMPVFVRHANVVCDILSKAAKAGTEVNMQDVFFRYTLDSIAEIGFGTRIGSLEDPEHPFARAFDGAQWHAEKRFYFPPWPLLEPFTPGGWKYRSSVKVLDDYCFNLIRERRASGSYKTGEDILSRFMRMKNDKGELILLNDDGYLRDVILNFLIAGRDTTAQALSWATHMLSSNPETEEKMLEEIHEACPGSTEPTLKIARSMAYTQAVVKETLRLWPSVPKDTKQAVKDDTLPDGTHIKAGWLVVYVPFAMGRDKRIWGEDAMAFRPERFVKDPNPSAFEYPVFNAGPRQCLGKDMAVLEATAALATIYKRFHLKPVPGQVIEPDNSLTMPMKHGIRVVPVPRSHS